MFSNNQTLKSVHHRSLKVRAKTGVRAPIVNFHILTVSWSIYVNYPN